MGAEPAVLWLLLLAEEHDMDLKRATGGTKRAINQLLCHGTVSPQLNATDSALGRAGPGHVHFFTVH